MVEHVAVLGDVLEFLAPQTAAAGLDVDATGVVVVGEPQDREGSVLRAVGSAAGQQTCSVIAGWALSSARWSSCARSTAGPPA
jgi:hypothetical protein